MKRLHKCHFCKKLFWTFKALRDHIGCHSSLWSLARANKFYPCEFCAKVFRTHPNLEYHYVREHRCEICCKIFSSKHAVAKHRINHSPMDQLGGACSNLNAGDIQLASSTFDNCFRIFSCQQEQITSSVSEYFGSKVDNMSAVINQLLISCGPVKLQVRMNAEFTRGAIEEDTHEIYDSEVNSHMRIVLNHLESRETVHKVIKDLENFVELFERMGSGWRLTKIFGFTMRFNKFKSLGGGCFIPTPPEVYAKKCVLNIQSSDKMCFKWSVLAALFPSPINKNKPSSYKKRQNQLIFQDHWFPMQLDTISEFEECNEIAVNVFSWDKKEGLIPVRISTKNYEEKLKWGSVDLLLLKDLYCENEHYACIRDISKLIGKQNHHKKELCYNCLQAFDTRRLLNNHVELCQNFKTQKVVLPTHDKHGDPPLLSFNSVSKQLKAGYVCYADFEAVLKKTDIQSASGNTKKVKEHKPSGFAYAVVRDDNVVVQHEVYRGEDCVEIFFQKMDELGTKVKLLNEKYKDPVYTHEDLEKFKQATDCHICGIALEDSKVYDHCHRTGN